jgi:cytidine deaminase
MNPTSSKLKIETELEVYAGENDLNASEKKLLGAAKSNIDKAYAPYSNFLVGAAVELENGEIITGNNQENAAYPSGLCAERVALFYAASQHPNKKIKAIAVACKTQTQEVASPCGACRQAIAEYQSKQNSLIRIIMAGQNNKVFVASGIDVLLPLMFNAKHLK